MAQVTIANDGTSAALPFSSSIGTAITIQNTNPVPAPPVLASVGYLRRAAGAANADYILTGYAVNPTSDGSFGGVSPGYTIQFWYAPDSATAFQYLWADAVNVSPVGGASGGAFRCFGNGNSSLNSNLVVRGLPNETFTASAPLLNLQNGWVHLAFRYDQTTNVCQWFVNGVPDGAGTIQTAGAYTWSQGNLSLIGANNTTAGVGSGGYDEIRVYDWSRTNADIAADFNNVAFGTGPSGESNLPDRVYWQAESAVVPHNAYLGTNNNPTATDTKIITAGTPMRWGGNSPGQVGLPASGLMNFEGGIAGQTPFDPYVLNYKDVPAQATSYLTPVVPAISLGHNFSVPQNPVAFALPDGASLFPLGVVYYGIPGLLGPYTYGAPDFTFAVPAGIFSHGDLIRIQFVAPDVGYPGGVGGSNQVAFTYSECFGNPTAPSVAPHARVEVRGAGSIQVAGFWEVHNTGNTPITRVLIDLSTSTGGMIAWMPISLLNSGGTMATGTSYRRGSEINCGLDFTVAGNVAGGYTEVLTGSSVAGIPGALQFDFLSFDSCIDSFIFDCGDAMLGSVSPTAANLTGNAAIGATVTVTFQGGATLSGTLAADPNDPQAAIIDL
jgi:hypothetical protein